MQRIKLVIPEVFSFSTNIPVRITDLNYGGHMGNDKVLSFIHEARVRFLRNSGYSELDFGGVGLIMSDAVIEFKSEIFYGDEIIASVAAGEFSKIGFTLYYKLEKNQNGSYMLAATAKTGMVCYDYKNKKIAFVPEEVKLKLTAN
ncbi:MAG: thioesterase family protein [Chitinophagaceae bacterium]|jgi:acyl-CoA thioesterase FadM|nr:thioesterase family protein [Chitinophagaceae bacterium]OQY92799.1 MAG: thioesterase [Sphingobacteriales bacterium UTBCD1]